jgi:hypothetical protein
MDTHSRKTFGQQRCMKRISCNFRRASEEWTKAVCNVASTFEALYPVTPLIRPAVTAV